jgi:hypothetical protein
VKADKRDARALAEACKLGAYRPAHRTSEEQRHVRGLLTVRDSLVQARARLVTLAQAILSREGLRVPTGSSGCFGERVERLGLLRPGHCRVKTISWPASSVPPIIFTSMVSTEPSAEIRQRLRKTSSTPASSSGRSGSAWGPS